MDTQTIDQEIEQRIAEIREDPERLRRYDRNGDGHIDAEEWAEVRRVVEAEIRGEIARQNRRSARPYTVPGVVSAPSGGDILEVLQGRFELIEKIGQGSQGQAFVGRDRHSDELVLVKEMHMAQVAEWKAVELYERESRTLKDLSHEAIPRFIDAFHTDTGSNAGDGAGMRFFLVQEFIEGKDLQELIDEGLTVDEAGARAFLREMLGILDYLHTRPEPVIHRDIKPANIIRRTDLRMALVDFGAVQSAQMESSVKTVVGTSGYMPMEQLMGRATPASDLYALAATVVHLLSRRHPADLPVVGMQMQFSDFISVSPGLRQALEKMLAVHVEDRPQSAREVLELLKGPPGRATPSAAHPDVPSIHFEQPRLSAHEMYSSGSRSPYPLQVLSAEQAIEGFFAACQNNAAGAMAEVAPPKNLPPPPTLQSEWRATEEGFSLVTRRYHGALLVVGMFFSAPFFMAFIGGIIAGLKEVPVDYFTVILLSLLLAAFVVAGLLIVARLSETVRLEYSSAGVRIVKKHWLRTLYDRTFAPQTPLEVRHSALLGEVENHSYFLILETPDDETRFAQTLSRHEQLYLCQEIQKYLDSAR